MHKNMHVVIHSAPVWTIQKDVSNFHLCCYCGFRATAIGLQWALNSIPLPRYRVWVCIIYSILLLVLLGNLWNTSYRMHFVLFMMQLFDEWFPFASFDVVCICKRVPTRAFNWNKLPTFRECLYVCIFLRLWLQCMRCGVSRLLIPLSISTMLAVLLSRLLAHVFPFHETFAFLMKRIC